MIFMLEIILILILLGSFVAMSVMIFTKIPALKELSSSRVKRSRGLSRFFFGGLLHKILSKFRVFILKTEHGTNKLLIKLRPKSLQEKNKFSEDYWKKIKRKK